MNEVFNKYILKLRSPKVLIAVGLVGILLIFLSSLGKQDEKKSIQTQNTMTTEEYREQLENDICDMVSNITGNKRVTVVITLENGIKYSYADTKEKIASDKTSEQTQTSDSELKEGYIIVKNSEGGEEALLITEQMPEVRGVAIVCEGGDNPIMNEKILNTVTAALNITSKRVYICGRKTE